MRESDISNNILDSISPNILYYCNVISKMEGALELIAIGERPDGTFNRDRVACQKLAFETLKAARAIQRDTKY